MSTLILEEQPPQLFECSLDDLSQISTPYPHWRDIPGVLIAGKGMLIAAGDVPGASDPQGWCPCAGYVPVAGFQPGAGGFKKRARDGIHTLRVSKWGEYWLIERWAKVVSGKLKLREMHALVFAFQRPPIWARTRRGAMLLAEHCDPNPRSPVAGYWAPAYTCT
jgi:hypothetical protein